MKIIPAVIGIGYLAVSWALAQQPAASPDANPIEGTRQLFYLAVKGKDALPPIRKAPAKSPTQTGAVHLGLRYNVVLVNAASAATEEIDPDRVLHSGECFALDFEANRSGYLYVLAKQSSGSWQALVPSFEMADETNVIDPAKKIRVPTRYCFEVHDPPGTETLFVVLSRDPRDFYELYDGIKRQSNQPPGQPESKQPAQSAPGRRPDPLQLADAGKVNSAVAQLTQQFGKRDIAIRKVARPAFPHEPPHSVYVVSTSDQPTSSLVAQIEIHHR